MADGSRDTPVRNSPASQLVLLGAVLPMTAGLRTTEAVAVAGERIVAVGDRALGRQRAGTEAEVLDFGERTLLPGFIDTHAHVAAAAVGAETMVDCRASRCSSVAEILQTLSDNLTAAADGWLMARSSLMLDQKLSDRRLPTRAELDSVSTTVPIALRTSHVSLLNSAALEAVRIEDYLDVAHGSLGPTTIELGSDGRPSGVVSNLDSLLPFPQPGPELVERALQTGTRRLFLANGVTSMCEMTDTPEALRQMLELSERNLLPGRFSLFLMSPATFTLEQACAWREQGIEERPGRFEVRGIKLFADGGFSSRDAAIKLPYAGRDATDPHARGKLNFSDAELTEILTRASEADLQVAFHTNGERAQEAVCRVAESLDIPAQLPVRLEHAGNFVYDKGLPELWRRAGAVPVPQAMFIHAMAEFMPTYLGPRGAQHGRLPFRTLFADGWRPASGSDAYWALDDEVCDPLWNVSLCMSRRGYSGRPIDPEESLDLATALSMYTVHGAALLGEEANRGTLEPGKLADLVVLDRDLTRDPSAENVLAADVDFVFIGGELVHAREGAAPPRRSVAGDGARV
jgi:hypothetical protein